MTGVTVTWKGPFVAEVGVGGGLFERAAPGSQIIVPASVAEALARNIGWCSTPLLRYTPPALVSPTTVKVPTTFEKYTFGENEDVILEMPAAARTSALEVVGGRNVQMIGGYQKLTSASTKGAPIKMHGASKSYYLEGVLLDAVSQTEPADALNIGGTGSFTPDVYFQKMRVQNVHGQNATNHSDIYQPQNPIGSLYVDMFTGDSNYQGFFLKPEHNITKVEMSRVNLKYNAITPHDTTTYLLWWLSNTTETPYPVVLRDVWVEPRGGQSLAQGCVWPNNEQTEIGCEALPDGSVGWKAPMKVTGSVHLGPPPEGDFVPESAVGLGYVSPGYVPVV